MPGLGQTLTEDIGPLPTWAWAGVGTAVLGGFLLMRKKNKMNQDAVAASNTGTQSNLGTVPVSNLTTQAEPMPIQMGDTFVNVPASTVSITNQLPDHPDPPSATWGGHPPVAPPPPAGSPPPMPSPTPAPSSPLLPPQAAAETGPLVNVVSQGWAAPPSPKPIQRTIVVKAGDTLSAIARTAYGDASKWTQIYTANQGIIGANPNLIHPGQLLVIP